MQYLVGHQGDVTTRYTEYSLLEAQLREVTALILPMTQVEVTLKNKGRGFSKQQRFAPRPQTREREIKKVLSIK
ncbi:MAG: hypothetical protein AAFV53_06660 [Myxococcota bacterium]